MGGGKQGGGFVHLHQQQLIGIAAQLHQAGGVNLPAFAPRIAAAQPDQRLMGLGLAQRQQGRKGRRARCIKRIFGIKFMQPSHRETAPHRLIEGRMASGQHGTFRWFQRRASIGEPRHTFAQRSEV